MKKAELIAYVRGACDRLISTMEAKNHDYTGDADDALANFKACEKLGIVDSAEQGILVRRMDKLMRAITFVRKGALKVTDETVEDTLLDDACYSLLMGALIHERRNGQAVKSPAVEEHLMKVRTGLGYESVHVVQQGGLWRVREKPEFTGETHLQALHAKMRARFGEAEFIEA